MKNFRFFCILTGLCGASLPLFAGDPPSLDSHLEPLRPWIEKRWKGHPATPKPGKETIDVVHWERALNGKAVRILHSINNGEYGGEAIVRWDPKKQEVVYQYFTTANFVTAGTMKFKEGKILTHEVVSGEAGGITEVKATIEMSGEGTYRQKTEILKEGTWQPGTETVYQEDPAAVVVFK